jgi:hypothetical protein
MTLYEALSLLLGASVLIAAVVTVIVYFRQLKAMQASLQHQLMMQRRELYLSTTSLSDSDIDTMMLHAADHFDRDVYEKRYVGDDKRIRSYFLMKRKYLYLVITTSYRTDERDPARFGPGIWMKELCSYQEFRDVHDSQGKYYPQFAALVDRELKRVGGDACKWAFCEWTNGEGTRDNAPR